MANFEYPKDLLLDRRMANCWLPERLDLGCKMDGWMDEWMDG